MILTAEEHAKALAILDTYSADTLALISRTAKHNNSRTNLLPILALFTDEKTVREVLPLHDLCARETFRLANPVPLIGIIRGLRHHDRYKDAELEDLNEEELETASALINVTAAIYSSYKNPPLHITAPNDPVQSTIYLNETASQLVTKHRKRTPELIEFLSKGYYYSPANMLAGLPHLGWYRNQTQDNFTDETITTAFNFLYLTAEITEHTDKKDIAMQGNVFDDDHAIYLDNPELEAFIESNPAQVVALGEYIRERKAADLKGFHEYTTNSTVLQTGTL